MKQCSLFCTGWLWALLALPALLLLPLLFFKWGAIEADVAKNTQQELLAAGANWAEVQTLNRGRNVLLTGSPPNQASIDQAVTTARKAYGVNSVTLSKAVKPAPSPAKLDVVISKGSAVLNGVLTDSASVQLAVQQAEAAFGANNVINKLSVVGNTQDLPPLNGFFEALAGRSKHSQTITATITGSSLKLVGTVESDTDKSLIDERMAYLFTDEVDNQLAVVPPPVKRDVCQDLVNELLNQGKINFETGKATIVQDSYALLQSIEGTARRCPNASFEVAGHTDSTGNVQFNMSLSKQRAQAVVDHLAGLGLNAEQFSAKGYGPNQAIADNTTAEGRAQNRRIEFKLKN